MHFSGVIAVRFNQEIKFEAEDGDIFPQRGFTIVVGCNASDIRQAFDLICNVVEREAQSITDMFELEQLEIQHIDEDDWDEEIKEQIGDFSKEIYYVSGRIYYSDEDLDE